MSIQNISRRALLAVLAAAALTGPLSATSYVRVSDEALVDESPLAVVARVTAVDRSVVVKDRNGSALVTEYVLEIEEPLKGEAPGRVLRMRLPGGVMPDGAGLKIFGMPSFRLGERTLVFLEPDGHGAWRPAHLLLGAFREVRAGERSLAVRNLREATEVRKTAAGVETVPGNDRVRDFDAFARWVAARGAGARPEPDYLVGYVDTQLLRQIIGRYTLFEDRDDGFNMRWFEFDTAGNVAWKAYSTGQPGVPGGGYGQFQAALQAWNADAATPIDYRYDGKTSSKNGLETYDTLNSIVFNDPTNILPAFSCASGGVLALGGPWYQTQTTDFGGRAFHSILNADIVINSGLACFFDGSPDATKAAQELFGHELGHTLGLGHSCGDSGGPDPNCLDPDFDEALMRAFIHDDQRGARLSPDDKAAIEELYSQVPAAPVHLTAAPQSTTEIKLVWDDVANNESGFRVEAKTLGGTYAEVATAPANSTSTVAGGLTPATGYSFRVVAIGETGSSAVSNEAVAATLAPVAACVADSHTLCLNDNRFKVSVSWKTSAGQTGVATHVAVPSSDSGLLWFFDQDNWEMLVKALDGCSVNNHYWVFFVAVTDVEYTLTVVDTKTGQVQVYFNPQGRPSPLVTDTSAFATCP
ncbi:MAG TPA: fibronectin type III domain-containing protein [Thermoanaerobaculia bacterium]|nr:fibronectin type III domain-containing protein [Thermoanaerobaculia bacterium]